MRNVPTVLWNNWTRLLLALLFVSSGLMVSAPRAGNSAANPAQPQPGLALNGGGAPGARSGAGFPILPKRARHSLPWLMMIFLVVFVPVVVRLARAKKGALREALRKAWRRAAPKDVTG